ncbi:selenocysteine-specific translation elongation factor [Akkermansiaceae bacterium]|nr:selenocysteine-specific translation elongation factor [Akkermansiaceae bacterium]
MRHLILGTAGHIDHGKSSLVKRLTGSDPDRLPEEKARGVTIELGFAHLSLTEKDTQYEVGIIDVPGHADFVNNMVAGVGALDVAVFIIAADDGWMPQSEEHLHILSYLGITNIVIVMTKSDLCDDVPFAVEMLKDELQDTFIADAPIIPVSSITGEGIDLLKQVLIEKFRSCPPHQNSGKPRLAIDRIFSPKGAGTVVTGTLSGGNVSIGDSLTLQPLGITTKVRFIQNHSDSLDTASPGMRTALNLPDLPIDSPGKAGAQRGHTLTVEGSGSPTDTLDISLTRLSRSIPGIKPKPLRHMETVVLHHGSTRCRARVILHGQNHLNAGESCLAQLRLESPLFLLTGDRIVLRDGAQQSTLAGGTVLDTQPARQGFRSEDRATFLQQRAKSPNDPVALIQSQLARDHTLNAKEPLANHPFSPETLQTTITQLLASGAIVQQGETLLHAKWWKTIKADSEKTIKAWHRTHPDLPSLSLEDFSKSLPEIKEPLTSLLISALSDDGYNVKDNGISHPSHSLTLPAEVEQDAQSILTTLNSTGLQPPNRNDITTTASLDQAMKFLIRSGKVIELEPKVVISAQTRDTAILRVSEFITDKGQATASELRQHLDTTRKIVMPLLEHLDAMAITVRNDNFRTLK